MNNKNAYKYFIIFVFEYEIRVFYDGTIYSYMAQIFIFLL